MSPSWQELMTEAEASGVTFDVLPSGQYDVQVAKAAHKLSKTDKSMYEVEFVITSGPYANRRLWNRYVISPESPKALAFFFAHMKALGLGPEFFATQPSDDAVALALVNKTCRVDVGQSSYNGQVRNDILKTLPGGVGASAPTPAPGIGGQFAPGIPGGAPNTIPTAGIATSIPAPAAAPIIASTPAEVAPDVLVEPVAPAVEAPASAATTPQAPF